MIKMKGGWKELWWAEVKRQVKCHIGSLWNHKTVSGLCCQSNGFDFLFLFLSIWGQNNSFFLSLSLNETIQKKETVAWSFLYFLIVHSSRPWSHVPSLVSRVGYWTLIKYNLGDSLAPVPICVNLEPPSPSRHTFLCPPSLVPPTPLIYTSVFFIPIHT